ncbi:biogenesis of lysosome-related organelles complex 1 subunit 2 [Harmonia axyridis]|uniref:biogenesis of lysosome-related organelles complex 1 subunit 2 n=1 Tax=Harmonia axyridis TaxID=115357 RepID=UPI001E2760C2|nr:biogenesis of lysosome-related organelles complex 1 subunit 2 [Harmonia axyridis]
MSEETDTELGVTDSPLRGPTLSTSTSSFEALDPHDPNLSRLATTMFNKSAEYLYGELTASLDDYRLIEEMNQATTAKYNDMKHIAVNVSKSLVELNAKYESLIPLLGQIDQLEDNVTKLEQAAYKLDAYTKRLEAKFKALEKR